MINVFQKTIKTIVKNNSNNNIKRLFCTININTTTAIPKQSIIESIEKSKENYIKILNDIRDNYTSKLNSNEIDKYIQLEQNIIKDDDLIDFHLGTFYSQGILVEKDNEKALEHFKRSADQNNSKGQFAYGLSLILNNTSSLFQPLFPSITESNKQHQQDDQDIILGNGWVSLNKESSSSTTEEFNYRKWLKQERIKSKSFKENIIKEEMNEKNRLSTGIRYLNLSAIQNLPIAQYNLGNILLNGRFNIEVNEKQGLYWLEKAANDFNDVKSSLELGKYYLSKHHQTSTTGNNNNEHDLIKSLKYLIQGSKLGDSESSFLIGSNFLSEDGEQQVENGINAIEYLKLSVEQGNNKSPTFLALLYLDGIGGVGEKSLELYKKYLEIAVERNDSSALLVLGENYFKGENGYDQSFKKALSYFIKSSNLNNSNAYINQGVMHFNGFGTNIDYTKAFYCYQNAFNLNNKNIAAISNLSNMYKHGLGVPISPENSDYFNSLLLKLQ